MDAPWRRSLWANPPETKDELSKLIRNLGIETTKQHEDGSFTRMGTLHSRGTPDEQIAGLRHSLRGFWEEHSKGFCDMWRSLSHRQRKNLVRAYNSRLFDTICANVFTWVSSVHSVAGRSLKPNLFSGNGDEVPFQAHQSKRLLPLA